jgi:hypothetical protein
MTPVRPVVRGAKRERGAINFVALFILASIAAAAYFSWVYLPVYVDDYAIKKAMRTAANVAYADRRLEPVEKVLTTGFAEVAIVDEVIALDGSVMKKPMPFDNRNWTIGFTQVPPSITIEVTYDRHIVWPFTKREKVLHFVRKHVEDLSEIKY